MRNEKKINLPNFKKIMRLIYTFLFILFINLLHGQKHAIGLPFFDTRSPKLDCTFCNLNDVDKEILKEVYAETLGEEILECKEIILNSISKNNSDNLNGRLIMYLFSLLGEYSPDYSLNDSLIYNISGAWYIDNDSGNYFKQNEIRGTLYMIDLMDKGLAYAKTPETAARLNIERFFYLSQSNVLDKLSLTPNEYIANYNELKAEVDPSIEMQIMEKYLEDKIAFYNVLSKNQTENNFDKLDKGEIEKKYKEIDRITGPFEYRRNYYLAPGVEYLVGKSNWITSELAFGVRDRNIPYGLDLIPFKFNFINVGINHDTKANRREYFISPLELKMKYFMLSAYRFGIHDSQLSSFKKGFFYRPEIGFHYGIFDVSYSYNLTFNKEIRPFTEKHLLSVGISYPLFRIGKYFHVE